MRWVEAVKAWNEQRGWTKGGTDVAWEIPRKGTAEHAEITQMMSGAGMPKGKKAKKAGYVGLLIAARGQKKDVTDYDPVARQKQMARTIQLSKMTKFSPYMLEHYGDAGLKKKMEPMRKQTVLKEKMVEGKKTLLPNTVRPTLLTHPQKRERRKKSEETGKQTTMEEFTA